MNTCAAYVGIFLAFLTSLVGPATGQIETKTAGNWTLTDITGREHRLFGDAATKAMVLVFISTDCPIANSYQPQLQKLAKNHAADGIRWFMVHPNESTTAAQAQSHAEQFQIGIPIVLDRDLSIARRAGATVTPEVVVYCAADAPPVYQGRIDNLYADYGKKRAKATTHELDDVLAAIARGQSPAASKTDPVGCFISFQQPALDKKPTYDPLKIGNAKIEQLELTFRDENRSREIPLRVYLPSDRAAAPVVVFSHGLGGSRDNNPYLGNHWAARGYVTVFVQHPGSDETVWKDPPLREKLNAMKKAANGENFILRVKDIPAVIDQLEDWNAEKSHPLADRMDLSQIGMSGHSFGAVTTQAVSGQAFLGRPTFTDSRIKAALAMSPSAPKVGDPDRAFGKVEIPWLLMTGTLDDSIIVDTDMALRRAVFTALPEGGKYELVLDQATHMAFSERPLPGDTSQRNPNHHRAILAISTAFWDAYLRNDAAAKEWLNGNAVRQILEPADEWKMK